MSFAIRRFVSVAAALGALVVARTEEGAPSLGRVASAQGAGMGGAGVGGATSGPSWGRPDVVNSPETEGPTKQARNSVKLFDQYRSILSYQLDVGPIWSRRATETTPITDRRNFERGAPLASEIALGTTYSTDSFKGPFYLAASSRTSLRILDSKSFYWALFEEKLGGGIHVGPFDFEAKLRVHFLSIDIMQAQPSVQMLSPGVEAGVGLRLGRIRLDIKGHTEYLWRWFGPDYYIRGVTIGLRFDATRPKNPFPGAPPGK